MQDREAQIRVIWKQDEIPVAYRPGQKGQKLTVKLPYRGDNRLWLSSIGRSSPNWLADKKCWEIPNSWFNRFVEKALERFGKLYIIQPYREQEKCARACMEATGHECNCSCMGANHGSGFSGRWFEVSEAFATRWKSRELACRLLVAQAK